MARLIGMNIMILPNWHLPTAYDQCNNDLILLKFIICQFAFLTLDKYNFFYHNYLEYTIKEVESLLQYF